MLGAEGATFDPATGNYQFLATDMTEFPPGLYTFNVIGFVGNPGQYSGPNQAQATAKFEMHLVNP